MLNKLDIILFGATGFTGRRTILELHKLIKLEGLSLKWGIAGRSEAKLKTVLTEAGQKNRVDLSNVPVIIADVNDNASLVRMTSNTKSVINTIGPYRFFGEAIVKACLKTSTHYVDVSGEPAFMEKMQLNYHEEAARKGIYLISSCGIDSIPADLGAIFLMKNFPGTLNSIETHTHIVEYGGSKPGPVFNYGTWESAIHGFANYRELLQIRSELFSKKLPQHKPKLELKKLFRNKITGMWSLPFPGADRAVMQRTQRFLYELYSRRPVQVHCYQDFEKLGNAILAVLIGGVFSAMCKYEWTRSILLKHPKLFSVGVFSFEGPSDEKQENITFHMYLEGKGWHSDPSTPTHQSDSPPNSKILVKITTKNPAYGATCTAVVLSAITILTESEKMPNSGGCFSPGFAFANTSLVEKLNKYGMKFEVCSKL